jgi:hypothetical protein
MKKEIILIIALFIFFESCKKKETFSNEDQEILEDNSYFEQINDDASKITDDAYFSTTTILVREDQGIRSVLADTVKLIKNLADSTITVDFGTNGILCKDGRTRSGKITFKFSNGYRKVNSSVTQTFDNYKVDNLAISNSSNRKITYNGINSLNQPNWKIQSDLTLTKSNGKVITWKSDRDRVMVQGFNTPLNWLDDVYEISGNASGISGNGIAYNLVINKNLLIRIGCRFIQEGIITMNRSNLSYSVDYGNPLSSNNCDNQATFLINGKSYVFTLK